MNRDLDELQAVASAVRAAAEAYVASLGKSNPRLAGWCLVVSVVLREALQRAGFEAEVVGGRVCYESGEYCAFAGHYWVACEVTLAPEWEGRCAFVDCTATQFELLGLPGAAVLQPGDERRRHYLLMDDDVGPDVMGKQDWEDVEAIERLLQLAVVARMPESSPRATV